MAALWFFVGFTGAFIIVLSICFLFRQRPKQTAQTENKISADKNQAPKE